MKLKITEELRPIKIKLQIISKKKKYYSTLVKDLKKNIQIDNQKYAYIFSYLEIALGRKNRISVRKTRMLNTKILNETKIIRKIYKSKSTKFLQKTLKCKIP